MKKNILITGANGMLAKHLAYKLASEYTVRFLTRTPSKSNEYLWDINKKQIDLKALEDLHSVIHLAGASIAEKRWTTKRKQAIIKSRVAGAELILSELKRHNLHIESFISASAIGYYGAVTTNEVFTENSPLGNDFLAEVCHEWENAAQGFKTHNIASRVAIARIGIILARNDGALKKIVNPIKWGIGSAIGSGNQYMPWIHLHDLSHIFSHLLINNELEGIYNAVAPQHITNQGLTERIAKILSRKILLPNVPKFILQILLGKMSIIILEGSKVSAKKILNSGFTFKFKDLNHALHDVLD